MSTVKIPEVVELMEAGVHFGHASGKWHPKMKPYIYGARKKLHLIDLETTKSQLESVLPILEERIQTGKSVVLVGTKKQVAGMVKEIGLRQGIMYVDVRWLGGTLTNFSEMLKSINRLKRTEAILAGPEALKMIKKERVAMENDLHRMINKFGGLRDMVRKPDCLFVIDPAHEHNAIKEAQNQSMEIFAICDTNADPSQVQHVIPANDEGTKSLKLILDLVEKTIENGKKNLNVKNAVIAGEKIPERTDDSQSERSGSKWDDSVEEIVLPPIDEIIDEETVAKIELKAEKEVSK